MSDSAKAELESELGGDLSVLELLTDEEAAEILGLFRDARREEQKALQASIDDTINALPWVFRGPARKIMFGGSK